MAGKTSENTEAAENNNNPSCANIVKTLEEVVDDPTSPHKVQSPDGCRKMAPGGLDLYHLQHLPEMVEQLSPGAYEDGDKTDQENMSDQEVDDQKLCVPAKEASEDESHTDVEELGNVEEEPMHEGGTQEVTVKVKRFVEEMRVNSCEAQDSWETDEETILCNDPLLASQLGPKTDRKHRRQRSQSQPSSSAMPKVQEGIASEREFGNLTTQMKAALREPKKLKSDIGGGKKRFTRSRDAPYSVTGGTDAEKLLRTFFTEDDSGNLTDEGEFLIAPQGDLSRSLSGLELDSGGDVTDTEDLDASSPGEWTETDPDSGGVRHVIRKTTHTTVTSGKQGESALRGGAKSTAETLTTTRDHHQPSDEEESLTFVQKKEFFEKLSEHSPPKDSSRGRLGSTPSLDTTLTRPVATQKPRPRSESLASQGEIVEESIVFSERLRLFQDKDDGSALLEPREAPADLERIEQRVRDVQYQLHTETGLVPDLDQTELRRAQAGPPTERAPSDVRSDVSSTPESLDGKSATRLLVRTSEPGKEAFDMRTTEFSDSEGIQEQLFTRVLVRSPVPEDGFDESPATGALEQLDSALHSAYRESPRPTWQEKDHMEGRPKVQAKGIGASVDKTAPEKQLAAEPEGLFSSAQSHLLASGLQMGLVAGSDILQKGIEASPKSGILEALSMPAVGTVGPEPHALPPDPSSPPDEVQVTFMGETVIKQRDFHHMGGQSVTVVSAPASSFQLSDVLSGKQPEMLDIGQHPSASSLLEGCVELSNKEPSADKYPAGKAILKTDYTEIQDKLSSAFGESIASIKGEKGSIKDVPKGLREALDGSARQFPRTRSEEDIEEFKGIVDTMEEALASQSIHKPKHGTVESIAEEVTEESLAKQSVSFEDDSSTKQREAELEEALESFVDALTTQPTKPKQAPAKQVLDYGSSELSSVASHGVCDTDSAPVTEKEKDTSGDREQKPTNDGTKKLLDNAPKTISESLLRNEPDDEESRQKKLLARDMSTHTSADTPLKDSEDVLTSERTTEPQRDYSAIVESSHTKKAETVLSTELQKPDALKEFRDEAIEEFYETTSDILATETDTYKKNMPCASSTSTEKGTVSQNFNDVSTPDIQVYSKSTRYMTSEESQVLVKADGPKTEVPETISSAVLPPHVATDHPASPHQKDDEIPKKTVVSKTAATGFQTTREKLKASLSEPSADFPGSLAYEVQDLTSKVIEIVKPREKVSFDVPDSSDEDQQSDLAKYKEVELAIPFNLGTSSSLEDDDGGSFSSGDLQLEKIAEFLTTDLEGVRPVHFPQVFQESTIIQQADGGGAPSSTADDESKAVPKKRVGFSVEGGSPDSADSAAELETREEMAGRIVNNVVHMATSLVESFGGEVTVEQVLRSPGDSDDRIGVEPMHQDVFGSPPGASDVSETLSQVPSVAQEPAGGAFGMKEIYQALKEGQEQRVQFSVRNVADLEEQAGYDEDERRRGSPTAESQDDQARVEKCSRELMMQLLDGFSQSDMELAEVRTEDEAPDIEDDVPSPEGGSAEDKSSSQEGGPRDRHTSGDNSSDLHRQSSLEVEIGSQTSGAQTALSEFEFESCPDASVAQAAGDDLPLASRASQERSPEEREQVATAGPAAASVATGRSAAGGREEKRSPLLEASPPEETAYRAEQDISPAQEYPDYLTPEMQVRVGVSPTETSPERSKPRDQVSGTEQAAVHLSESSVESSSDVFSPKAPASDTDAMAFENVAFAGEDVIDASSSPVEESGSSPAGSRSPYEVVRDGATEKAEATVMGAHLALRTEEPQDDDERKDEPPGEKRVTPTRPRSLLKSDEGTPEMHVGSEAELRIETHVYGEELNQLAEESALEKREFSEGFLGAGLLSVGIGDARTPESRRGDSDEDEEEWADHVLSKIQGRPIPPTPPASPRAVQSAVEIEERVTWETPVVEQQELSVEVVREIPAEKQVIVEHDEESAITDGDSTTARKRPLLEHIPSEISDEDLVEREQSPTHISATCRGDRKDSSSDRNSSPDSDGPKAGGSHRRSASEATAIVVETEQKQPPDDKSSDGDHGKKADDKITKDAALSDEAMGVIEEETPIEFFAEREAHTPDEAQGVPHSSTGKFSSSSGSPPQRKSDGESCATGVKGEGAVVLRSKARTSARKGEKRASRDLDTGHSGSETDQSHYYSFEMTSDSGKTPGVSRPTSSEFDLNILSGHASSEYETCVTSQDGEASGSYATAATSSQEASYATARSSLSGSSRGSAYSVDSESSGHLGSLEASSEASETIVASAHEDLDSDDNESQRSVSGLREPYDGDIPESVIRGGVEVPFLPSWQSVQKGFDATRASIGQMVERRSETSSFQGITRDTLAEYMTGSVRWPAERRHDELDRIGRTEATHASSKLEALNGAAATSDGHRRPRSVDESVSNEEEQLSVSESSATQSEHTWQTSVETVVDVVQTQRFSCDNERYQRQSTMLDSVPLPLDEPAMVGDAMDVQVQDAADNGATPPFREINGPVEVDYVPEYDDLVAPPRGVRPLDSLADAEFVAAPAEELSNAAEDFLREHTEAETLQQQQQQQVYDEECEGFYAETFQGELSTEEVEGAVSLADRQYVYSTGSDGLSKDDATTKEPFERPATPEPPDEIELQEDDGCFPESDQLKSSQTRLGSREPKAAAADVRVVCTPKTATVVKDDLEDACLNEPESNGSFEFVEKTDVIQTACEDEPFEIIPAQSDFCPAQSCCLPENKHAATKAYTSKCEDYLMHMQQTYKYGTIVEKNASESSFPPEEAMDVENVNLLAGKLQEGNGQQGFPYDLSYQQEYADDGRAEYGDLYTHQEVEEEDDDRSRSRSGRRLSPISDERGSTPDYDTLAGRKTFGKGSERDDASTSSLMEFERLEAEMASGGKSSSVGSSDSFSGRLQQARNGGSEQDSVSVNSLTEFEKLEKELVEAEGVDGRLREEPVARLDEIDEGHESQASDPDQELYEGLLRVRGALTESDLQKFVAETEEADGHSGRARPDTLPDHWRDKTQVERDFTSEHTERHFLTSRTESGHSVDSIDRQSSASTATQYDADSLKEREMDDFESNQAPETPGWTVKDAADVDRDSLHESERHDSLQEYPSEEKDSLQGMDPSAEMDSLQDDGNNLQDSLHEAREIDWDSFHGDDLPRDWHRQPSPIRTTELSPTMSRPAVSPLVAPVVIERIDTLTWVRQDGEPGSFPAERLQGDALISSTDSLEPSSSANTHATYQFETDSVMSSSLMSAEESTMASSTDTLDQEAVRSGLQGRTPALESPFHRGDDTVDSLLDEPGEFFFDGNATMRRVKRRPLEGGRPPPDDVEARFREYLLQSVVTPEGEEQVEERQTLDERGNVVVTRTVKRHLTSEPQLHTQTFSGPDAEERSRAFVASFAAVQPSADKDEYEGFDDAGNAVRVTQRMLVKPSVKTVTFTGPDARAQMQEYMRNSGVGPQSSAENTPTSDSGVGVCSSLASPPALAPDPPATTLPSTAWPGLRRLSGGDQWMEEESALEESAQPVATSRVITTRTIRTVCPDGQEQVVTTTSCDDDSEVRMRRSMQGVLDSFLADSGPPAPARGYLDDNEE
ncbi:unnamed protein product [Ixodes persulcatus]